MQCLLFAKIKHTTKWTCSNVSVLSVHITVSIALGKGSSLMSRAYPCTTTRRCRRGEEEEEEEEEQLEEEKEKAKEKQRQKEKEEKKEN